MRLAEDVLSGVTLDAGISILSVSMVTIENTSVTVSVSAGQNVESIKYKVYQVSGSSAYVTLDTYVVSGNSRVFNFTKTGLSQGTSYLVDVVPYGSPGGSGDYGNTTRNSFTTTKPATAATIESFRNTEGSYSSFSTDSSVSKYSMDIGSSLDTVSQDTSSAPQQSTLAKNIYSAQDTVSIFQLSNPNKGRTKYITAEKSFTKLDTSKEYYSFGTNMYMKAAADSIINCGGIMIFSSNYGQTGYFISIQSADSADIYKQNAFRILKLEGGSVYAIDDSQQATAGKFASIYNGESYKIDILVKKTSGRVDIVAYINGFKITASDINSDTNTALPATNAMSLVCAEGTVFFDYVYSTNSDYESYKNQTIYNNLGGKFSRAILNSAFGENLLSNNTNESSNASIEEFGTAARELRYYNVKYSTPPAYPSYATTGSNGLISIIGQKLTSFGAELYVLNNSSMFASLSDGDVNNLWVIGKNVVRTGEIEYLDDQAGKFSTPEPVIFQSTWIQKNSDAVALAEWIKNSWSKKQQVFELTITGNPLMSVGDIVVLKYSYLGLDGTQKFIVTNVNQSYSEGLETSISCRTL